MPKYIFNISNFCKTYKTLTNITKKIYTQKKNKKNYFFEILYKSRIRFIYSFIFFILSFNKISEIYVHLYKKTDSLILLALEYSTLIFKLVFNLPYYFVFYK